MGYECQNDRIVSLEGQVDSLLEDNCRLQEALRAAEAEIVAARVMIITGRYGEDYGEAMRANDATRARLGLGKIGGGE